MSGPTSRRPESSFQVFLALGSNVEPEENLPRAVERLARRLRVKAVSRVYETAPVGGAAGAPAFWNAAVLVETGLAPRALKHDVLRPLEASLGRVRGGDRNAPRPIDLDIALFDQLILDDPVHHLTIPDPEVLTRAHVALPLADLSPETRHPVTGETLGEIAARFTDAPGIEVREEIRLAVP